MLAESLLKIFGDDEAEAEVSCSTFRQQRSCSQPAESPSVLKSTFNFTLPQPQTQRPIPSAHAYIHVHRLHTTSYACVFQPGWQRANQQCDSATGHISRTTRRRAESH